ncbi:MAG: hypothetical protein PHU14_01620 [Methylovulum sp.]|nr:hypothetical protein [Methylovulum sp.]
MNIRQDLTVSFLEILWGDIQELVNHSADAPFLKRNTVLITGLVNGLAVAYSASDFADNCIFLDTLEATTIGLKNLAKLNIGTPAHCQHLLSMSARVAAGLAYYKPSLMTETTGQQC